MRLSKINRTHLVYQFIILTLIYLWIAQHELMLDKKFLFLIGLIPAFLYQMMTISWWWDLLPENQRSCLSYVIFGTTEPEEKVKEPTEKTQESKEPKKDADNVGESSLISPVVDNKHRTYKFRGWQKSPDNLPSPPKPPFDATEAEKTFPRFTWSSEEHEGPASEVTKRYYFPYRQKRPEEWIDQNGMKRPCKIKPRVSNIDEQDEEKAQAAESQEEASVMSGSPKLKKSYTFPRQTRKTDESDCSIVGMPLIPNKEYLAEARNRTRRRRSASISNLKTDSQEQLESYNNRKQQEFSQSVEISCPAPEFNRTPSRSGKVKAGFFSYFSKMKREGSDSKAKKRTQIGNWKHLLQSRESLKTVGSGESGRSKKSVTGDNEGFTYYPGYSLFDTDPDTFDSRAREEPSEKK